MSGLPEDEFGPVASCSLSSGGLTLVKGSLELSGLFLVQAYLKVLLQRNYAVSGRGTVAHARLRRSGVCGGCSL